MTSARLPHRRGIDGLRALAVTAVLLYHADVSWVPGGFLGVDVFFVISGYLITSLLLAEAVADGRISLGRFWARRARRLLPALGLLLIGVTIAALVGAHDAVDRLRGDVLAAVTYSSNWWQIVRGETYFDSFGRPPLLRHLWSLAVEEQLYIVLPLLVGAATSLGWVRRRRALAVVVLLGALGSWILLAALWRVDDPSRAWFGTDTRAGGLLVGVAFALLWPMGERRRWSGFARVSIDAAAVSSIVALSILVVVLDASDPALPRWGFAVASVVAGIAVVALSGPGSRVARLLSLRPIQWIGTRSYAIYLWHWPVFVLARADRDIAFDGWRPLAARLLLTGVLAEASWRAVEQPFRTGSAGRTWRSLRRPVRVRIAGAGAVTVAVLGAGFGVGLTTAATEPPELLATVSRSPTTATTFVEVPQSTTATSSTTTTAVPVASPTTAAPAAPPQLAGPVLAVGDSVMLSAKSALESASSGRILVDAAIGRQVKDGLMVLQGYKDRGTFPQISALVIHLGTNGAMSDDLFNQLAMIVDGVPRVVLLNVRVPKSWEGQSNAAINGGVTRFSTMRLADWHAESLAPGVLENDGVHPTPAGARVYSAITLRQLDGAPPPTTTPTTTTTAATTTTSSPPAPPVTVP